MPFKPGLHTFILFHVICMQVHPTTYFINSKSGNNHNNGLSPEYPFYDFWKLDEIDILPGDSILFARNTSYTGYFTMNSPGSGIKPVLISSYGEGALPSFSNPGEWYAIGLRGNHIILDGVHVENVWFAGVQVDSNHCTVKNCTIQHVGFGINLHGNATKILNNRMENLHIIQNTPGGNDDYGAVGVQINNGNNEIAFNTFKNCIDTSFDFGVDGGAVEFFGDIDSMKIHHNYAENCDGFFEVGGGTIKNIEIYYNLMVGNGEIGGFHFNGDFDAVVENFKLINNTVYDISHGQYEVLWFNGNTYANEIALINNIIVYDGFQRFSGEEGFQHEHNIYYSPSDNPPGIMLNENEIIGEPGFISPESNNFGLSPGSPCIDQGKNHFYQTDYLSNIISGNPDLGAIEYQPSLRAAFFERKSNPVYPNPSVGVFHLNDKNNSWKVYQINGSLLLQGSGSKIDLTGYKPGLYFLKTDIDYFRVMLLHETQK